MYIIRTRPLKTTPNVAESQIALSIMVQRRQIRPSIVATLELMQYGFSGLAAVAAGLPLRPCHSLAGF